MDWNSSGRVVAMQREQAVENRRPAQQVSGELLRVGAEVDRQAYPGRPAAVVTAHAVHHRNGVRRTGQVRRDRSSRTLPADTEALCDSDDIVEMAGQCVDEQPPRQGQVILVAVERQAGQRLRVGGGTGQVASTQAGLGGHEMAVGELEPAERADRERVEQLEPPASGPHRLGDVVVDEVVQRQQVQGDAMHESVAGPLGEIDDASRVAWSGRGDPRRRHGDRCPYQR
jgi:hypothetical protein